VGEINDQIGALQNELAIVGDQVDLQVRLDSEFLIMGELKDNLCSADQCLSFNVEFLLQLKLISHNGLANVVNYCLINSVCCI